MIYIGIGILGFLVAHTFDIFCLKKVPLAKPISWGLGCLLLIYSLVMMSLSPEKLPLPAWAVWLGWVLLPPSFFLLVYALFVNLPFRKTYVEAGVGDKLIKTGLYALVRHPGVYWVALFFFSLVFISRSPIMLIAAPILVVLNTALVIVQDKFYFPKMFEGYDKYQQETPMLVPNRRSIKAFINSLNQTKVKSPS